MLEIEKYSIIDSNTSNNVREYCVKNSINTVWIKESDLKQKITSNELKVSNAIVSNNGRVVWQNNTGVNARIQDFMMRFLNIYSGTFNRVDSIQLVRDIYNELYMIYYEDRRTQGTKELTDHILEIIESMCSYIRDTRYTLKLGGKLDLKFKNITHVEYVDKDKVNKQLEYYINQLESKLNRSTHLDCKEIVESISNIKKITPLLKDINRLNNEKYTDVKQATLDLINTIKNLVDFTVFDYFSYDILDKFSTDISNAYYEAIRNHRSPVIKILTESEQEQMIRTMITPLVKDYDRYKINLHKNRNKINTWFKTYSSQLGILTDTLSEPINIDNNSESACENVLNDNKDKVEKCINIVIKESAYSNTKINDFSDLIQFIADTVGKSKSQAIAKSVAFVFSKKKRDLASKELSAFANEMINKLDTNQTEADRLIMLYLCDRIEVEHDYNALGILDKPRQNYVNLRKIVDNTRTYKSRTYLSLLIELMTINSGEICINKDSIEFKYKTEDFMKAWLIAYRTLLNNVKASIKMNNNWDTIFWLLFEEVYHRFSTDIPAYKNKDKVYYHTIMNNYNITIGTKFVSHAETKIDISKYITN